MSEWIYHYDKDLKYIGSTRKYYSLDGKAILSENSTELAPPLDKFNILEYSFYFIENKWLPRADKLDYKKLTRQLPLEDGEILGSNQVYKIQKPYKEYEFLEYTWINNAWKINLEMSKNNLISCLHKQLYSEVSYYLFLTESNTEKKDIKVFKDFKVFTLSHEQVVQLLQESLDSYQLKLHGFELTIKTITEAKNVFDLINIYKNFNKAGE